MSGSCSSKFDGKMLPSFFNQIQLTKKIALDKKKKDCIKSIKKIALNK